jgi:hypothetical protein
MELIDKKDFVLVTRSKYAPVVEAAIANPGKVVSETYPSVEDAKLAKGSICTLAHKKEYKHVISRRVDRIVYAWVDGGAV